MVDTTVRLSRQVKVRRVGGSDMVAIPRAMLTALDLEANAKVRLDLADGRLTLTPAAPHRPRFTLDELLAQCDPDAPVPEDDRAWTGGTPVGDELI